VPNCSIARRNGLRVRGILDGQRSGGGLQDESLEWVSASADIEQPNHDAVVRAHSAAAVLHQLPVGLIKVAPYTVPVYGAASSRTSRKGLRG